MIPPANQHDLSLDHPIPYPPAVNMAPAVSTLPRRSTRKSLPTTSASTPSTTTIKRARRDRLSAGSGETAPVKVEDVGDEVLLPPKRRRRGDTTKKQVVEQSEDVKPNIDIVDQAATIVEWSVKSGSEVAPSLLVPATPVAGPSETNVSLCGCAGIKPTCGCVVGLEGMPVGYAGILVKEEAVVRDMNKETSIAPVKSEPMAGPSKPVKGKKKEKAVEVGEFRPARFRKKCPKNTKDRVDRVMTQRMFLVDRERIDQDQHPKERFKVLGSTGNVYTIHIGALPSCDCPDCIKGNVPCKHIVFVFLKVLKVPENNDAWYQKGLTASEVQEIFSFATPSSQGSHVVSDKIKNAYLRATGMGGVEEDGMTVEEEVPEGSAGGKRMSSIGEDCPVCYEEMSQEDQDKNLLVYDEALAGCGKPLHKECFGMWVKTAQNKGDAVTCVWCRTPWPVGYAGGAKRTSNGEVEYNSLGYMNVADLAGISRQRDTSSYYWGPMAGRTMASIRYRYSGD